MHLLIGVAMFAISCLVTVLFIRVAKGERLRAASAATSLLDEAGLAPQGDVFGIFTLRATMYGVQVDLQNRVNRLPPGKLEGEVPTCVVNVAVPIPDQIVFEIASIDQVMGLLPTAPRVRTGYAPFDEAYATFVVATGEAAGGSYRSSANAIAVPWGHSLLLERLRELGLLWLRVKEGRAEIVFPPLPLGEVQRAMTIAAAVARSSQGNALPALEVGKPAQWVAWPDPLNALYALWGLGAVLAVIIGAYVSPDDSIDVPTASWMLVILSLIVTLGASFVAIRRGWTSSPSPA